MDERHRRLLVRQNPHWQGNPIDAPAFERDLLADLMKSLEHKQAVAVVGLRRVGKTVLLHQVMKRLKVPAGNICYISFDDIDFQKYETGGELIDYFLESSDSAKMRYLFLDEIQKLRDWASLIKTYYDSENNLKIFVSGSASLDLKAGRETLAGRILSYHLPVVSFGEYARYHGMEGRIEPGISQREYDTGVGAKAGRYQALLLDYLHKGAFPELFDASDLEFISKYIREAVVEKSIADISRATGESEKNIYELFRLLASNTGQPFEVVNIASALKLGRNLVSSYIGLLEKAFLISVSYNYTASVAKQVRTAKKQHVAHSCIAIALLQYPPGIISTPAGGHLVEGVIAGATGSASFWRSPRKEEVDIVLCGPEPVPVEVKYQESIAPADTGPLRSFCAKFGAKRAFVVTKGMFRDEEIGGVAVRFIPAWLYLLTVIRQEPRQRCRVPKQVVGDI